MSGPVVLLDLSCFRFLRPAESRTALSRQLSIVDATTVGTAVNMIEILRHGSATARTWLRDVHGFLAGGRALLPWPYGLLERVGKAISSGATQFQLAPSGFEHLLTKDPTPTVLARADGLVEEMEERFRTMQDEARPLVQEFVRDRGLIGEWDGAREFLDEMWMRPSHIDDYILGVWEKIGLPLPCPVDEVRQNPSWRVFFEAYGVAAYEQAILPNKARTFGMLDLLQLVYPTGFTKGSIFVTNDNSLARVGEIVVTEVVPGARVMKWNDFIDR